MSGASRPSQFVWPAGRYFDVTFPDARVCSSSATVSFGKVFEIFVRASVSRRPGGTVSDVAWGGTGPPSSTFIASDTEELRWKAA